MTVAPIRLRLAPVALLIALLAAAATAPAAGAVLVRLPNGRFLGLAPRPKAGATPAPAPAAADARGRAAADRSSGANAGTLAYHGGSVLHATVPYLVFWDPAHEISAASRSLVARYLADSAADSGGDANVWAVDRQYTDGSGLADYRQTFGPAQAISDDQPLPARDPANCSSVASSYPNCVTDRQLTAELARLQGAGTLPVSTAGGTPVDIVITPPDTNLCTDASDCASSTFCAYHSSTGSGPSALLYAAVPMFFSGASAAQDPKACQPDGYPQVQEPNGDLADVAVKALSHELSETITDPTGEGWYNDSSGNEVADNCSAYGPADPAAGSSPAAFEPVLGGTAATGSLFDQSIAGDRWYTQSEWSNANSTCETRPASSSLLPAFSAPASSPVGAPVALDPSATTSSLGLSSVSWSFGDGSVALFEGSAAATGAVQHSFTAAGRYLVTLTATDADGNQASASHQVVVGDSPAAAFLTAPAATAAAGQPVLFNASGSSDPGAAISDYHWSFGDGSTGSGLTTAHAFRSAGSYTVVLTVTSAFGAQAQATGALTVAAPVASAARPSPPPSSTAAHSAPPRLVVRLPAGRPAAGSRLRFVATTSAAPGERVISTKWAFGDGSAGSGDRSAHIYRRAGVYTVSVTVIDSVGRRTTVHRRIRIAGPPPRRR